MPGRLPSDDPAMEGPTRYEGEGEDEAEGSHLTVSGFGRRGPPFSLLELITNRLFPDVYAESGKWFRRAAEMVSSPRPDETIFQKFNGFS